MSDEDQRQAGGPAQRLYELLPNIYRFRDRERDFPLRTLIEAIAEGAEELRTEIGQLYDNWFIETCDPWVVPYIADLVGYRRMTSGGEPAGPTAPQTQQLASVLYPRAEVANTIRYRRRKGTLAVLELLAADLAGWPARAVECFDLVARLGSTDPVRPGGATSLRLSDAGSVSRIQGPFDSVGHTLDVRGISTPERPGRYNLPGVGLYVWRLRSYSVTFARPQEAWRGHYYFSPFGQPMPLFIKPTPETDPAGIAGEINVPAPLRRQTLRDHMGVLYGAGKSLCIFNGQKQVRPDQVAVADLSRWEHLRPPTREQPFLVDPELGRLSVHEDYDDDLHVSYHYGFSADLGGGEYPRKVSRARSLRVGAGFSSEGGAGGELRVFVPGMAEALDEWRKAHCDTPSPGSLEASDDCRDTIDIVDSGDYPWNIPSRLEVPKQRTLRLRAVRGVRPMVRLEGAGSIRLEDNCCLVFEGLLLAGRRLRIIAAGTDCSIRISHCTLVSGQPGRAALKIFGIGAPVKVEIDHSIIVGGIRVDPPALAGKATVSTVSIEDSIVDAVGPGGMALHAYDPKRESTRLVARRSTILGNTYVGQIDAINTIFDGKVATAEPQGPVDSDVALPADSLSFCYLAEASDQLRQHMQYCEPSGENPQLRPHFRSRHYGDPCYCRLADSCPKEVRRGADDGSEMGVYHDLYLAQREAMLRERLDEYTVAAMRSAILFAD